MQYSLLVDFDHCLAPFDHDTATERVKQKLQELLGDRGAEAGEEFGRIFYHMMDILHSNPSPEAVEANRIINSYPIKRPSHMSANDIDQKWSRELWIRHISDKYRLDLDGDKIATLLPKLLVGNPTHI